MILGQVLRQMLGQEGCVLNCVPGGLADGEEEGLESGKVSDQLEDAEDLGDAHQPHHLARLPDDVELAQVVHDEVDKVGQDGEQVHQVHLRDHGRYVNLRLKYRQIDTLGVLRILMSPRLDSPT